MTGNIGSGKSTVSRHLAELGATVVDADQLAREAVAPGSEGLARIVDRFGPEVLDPEGALDRRALGRRVFEDPEALRALEAIVHPVVSELFEARVAEARARGARIFVYDVPLLFERGLESKLDLVVVVWAEPATRRTRVAARDGLSAEEIDARIASQMPLEAKVERADHVIDNDGSPEATQAATAQLFSRLDERARGSNDA